MKSLIKYLLILLVLVNYNCKDDNRPVADRQKTEAHATAQKPNIIFFIADDMYPWMFNNLLKEDSKKKKNLTPNIDRLAKEGVWLDNMKVVSPVCTPSRYNSLTGNYASRATNESFLNFTKKNDGQTVFNGIRYRSG